MKAMVKTIVTAMVKVIVTAIVKGMNEPYC
jgi:hypothetical protein